MMALGRLPLPYRPMHRVSWPEPFNKLIRFAREPMLLAVGDRYESVIAANKQADAKYR